MKCVPVKLSELHEGDLVQINTRSLSCLHDGTICRVFDSKEGPWIHCAGGMHMLSEHEENPGDLLTSIVKLDRSTQ